MVKKSKKSKKSKKVVRKSPRGFSVVKYQKIHEFLKRIYSSLSKEDIIEMMVLRGSKKTDEPIEDEERRKYWKTWTKEMLVDKLASNETFDLNLK